MAFFLAQLWQETDFFAILKFLHFADNSAAVPNAANDDRLHKIRPVVEHLRGMFRSVFNIHAISVCLSG